MFYFCSDDVEIAGASPETLVRVEAVSYTHLGFTIGSGIITQTGIGIGMTGRSIFLAFLVSAALFLISFRPIFMMSTLLPLSLIHICCFSLRKRM